MPQPRRVRIATIVLNFNFQLAGTTRREHCGRERFGDCGQRCARATRFRCSVHEWRQDPRGLRPIPDRVEHARVGTHHNAGTLSHSARVLVRLKQRNHQRGRAVHHFGSSRHAHMSGRVKDVVDRYILVCTVGMAQHWIEPCSHTVGGVRVSTYGIDNLAFGAASTIRRERYIPVGLGIDPTILECSVFVKENECPRDPRFDGLIDDGRRLRQAVRIDRTCGNDVVPTASGREQITDHQRTARIVELAMHRREITNVGGVERIGGVFPGQKFTLAIGNDGAAVRRAFLRRQQQHIGRIRLR